MFTSAVLYGRDRDSRKVKRETKKNRRVRKQRNGGRGGGRWREIDRDQREEGGDGEK